MVKCFAADGHVTSACDMHHLQHGGGNNAKLVSCIEKEECHSDFCHEGVQLRRVNTSRHKVFNTSDVDRYDRQSLLVVISKYTSKQ